MKSCLANLNCIGSDISFGYLSMTGKTIVQHFFGRDSQEKNTKQETCNDLPYNDVLAQKMKLCCKYKG